MNMRNNTLMNTYTYVVFILFCEYFVYSFDKFLGCHLARDNG